MPISPADAKKKREAKNVIAYQVAVESIDGYLTEDVPNANGEHWLHVGMVPEGCRERFIREYEQAGWNVRIECDQRDGDCFVLSPGRKGR